MNKNNDINPDNEVIKEKYYSYCQNAKGYSDKTIKKIVQAIRYYEESTNNADFRTFNKNLAIDFKKYFDANGLALATKANACHHLIAFFIWLGGVDGYKKAIDFHDIQYFNVTREEKTMNNPPEYKERPTLEQARAMLLAMPQNTDIEWRNKIAIAIMIATGFRIDTLISLSIGVYNPRDKSFHIKPTNNGTRAKFAKELNIKFFPVGDDIIMLIIEWIDYCKTKLLFNGQSPIIPASTTSLNDDLLFNHGQFAPQAQFLKSHDPIRKALKQAWQNVGIQYYNPHAFRHMLADLGQELCKSPLEQKAWSQNLGHSDVSTTFEVYGGKIPYNEQASIMDKLSNKKDEE